MSSSGQRRPLATDLDRLAGQLSTALIVLPVAEIDSAITETLRDLAQTLDCDRTSLFTFSEDEQRIDITYFWYRPGTPPIDTRGDAERLRWVMATLGRGQQLVLERIPDDLPPEAVSEIEWLKEYPVKSALLLPVVVAGRRTAVMVVAAFRDYHRFPPEVIERLRLIGEILSLALHRARQARALEQSRADVEQLKARLEVTTSPAATEPCADLGFDDIVGQGPAMREALARVLEVASTDATALLLGETGTGKELVARAIHERSPRRGRPFVRVNCAALPPTLIESELFGHERGAFTGAVSMRQGRFELADRGTIFLDEIGDLPLDVQAKLLRVLQEREFERLGSSTSRKVDVRIVAATHRDLAAMAAAGQFRPDLYYRLCVFPIRLPPLRERREDIAQLVWFFIHQRQRALHRQITAVPAAVMASLERYGWPGNVRELQNVIERALIRSRGGALQLDDALSVPPESPAPPGRAGEGLDEVERAHIERVLAATGWRINGPGNAAERLNLHPNTLRFRMKKLGIVRPSKGATGPT